MDSIYMLSTSLIQITAHFQQIYLQWKQENPTIEFDKDFGVKIAYYKNQTQFIQPILSTKSRFKLSGAIEYMTCNEEKCLPFNYKFEILINHQD